jgi:ADP-heptose:LPS heptosyltransferase
LGDTVAALPCFHLIERAFPDSERLVLTNVPVSSAAAPLEVILKDGGFIHGAIPYPLGLRSPAALARLATRLRRQETDTMVYLAESRGLAAARRDVAFFRLCGFRNVIGAPLTADLQTPRGDEQGELERESHRLGRTLSELGTIDFEDRSWWDLRLTDGERATGAAALGGLLGRPFLAVHTGGKSAEKDWGEANWGSLLDALGRELTGWGLVFVGADEDRNPAERLGARWCAGPTVNLAGQLSPRASAAALTHAELFVGHDSGPLHLADAVGTRCVGLYGSFNRPKVWHPGGQRTRIIHRIDGLTGVTVEEVAATATGLFSDAGALSTQPPPSSSVK